MTWFYATSVSVTNGATVVSVNAGDDIAIIQPGDGLVIGTQPPVEVKRTYLDGGSNKKIELLKPWPYGSQTNQAAVAFPTDGDLAAATAVLKQLIDGFTLASQADAEGGSENTRPMTAFRVKQAMDKQLGTASKLPATTTAGDHSQGRVARVGDFGNGFMMDMRAGQSVPFSNYDTPSKCWGKGTIRGFIDGAALGIPGFSATAYGVVEIHGQYSDASGGSGVHQRFYYEGLTLSRVQSGASSWSNWSVIGAPILGAAAFNAGLSTGAILEYGSNSNGTYLRMACGTLICTRNYNETVDITTPEGALYRNASALSWNFPAQFLSGWPVAVSGQFPAVGAWLSQRTDSSTSVIFFWQAALNFSADGVATLMAVGRWRS